MTLGNGINASGLVAFERLWQEAEQSSVATIENDFGPRLIDCGIDSPGGLQAGIRLAEICLANRAQVQVTAGDREVWAGPWVTVQTDSPLEACMLGQYAGWPVQSEGYFAMGSGPMRVRRGKEELLKDLKAQDADELAVGTLESDKLPSAEVLRQIASETNVAPRNLCLAIAPTRSIAGCVQVVARSIETALHKLHELGFSLASVASGFGTAPLCPPIPDFAKGIGRTNDAILYGSTVSLWVDEEDDKIREIGPKIPSCASQDYGKPFFEIFKGCDYDFYKIDPGLFSPAEVILMNLRSGRSWKFGARRCDLIAESFGCKSLPESR